ncbi:MAG: hypothetical protein H6722_34515 [Sandaracinus sp.]|nr:hypothetical protein [Sandaracinus sp.]MCB9611293.1 hypothetical protein [Sandaracinus sp.]MCB9617576.1 hypothetical protein [Sandaracinus sp.]
MILLAPLLLLVPALAAGCAVGLRLGRDGARGALDRTLVAFAVLALPPYLLGWLGHFTPGAVGLSVVGTSLLLLGVSRAPLGRVLPDLWALVLGPWHLARDAWREGDRVLPLALTACAAIFAWTALLTYLAPSTSWDGMWYHDSMVGFAVQNRGFEWVDLPRDATQVINGYPRLIETVAAAFVVTSDATWIELPSILAFPALGVALVALAQNAAAWRRGAYLFACLFLLAPGVGFELRSTYIDVPIDFLLVAVIAGLTRPRLTRTDLWMAALALAMLAGAKSTAAVLVPLLAALGLLRGAAASRLGWRRWWPFAAGAVGVLLCAAPVYLRNFERTENPFWPLALEGPLGLSFEGPLAVVVRWPPFELWLREMYGWPMQGLYHPDVRPHGYGHALPFVLPPLLFVALPDALRALRRFDATVRARIALVGLAIVMAYLTREVMWWGRFGFVPLVCLCAPLLAFLGSPRRRALAAWGMLAVIAVHFATLVAGKPGFAHTPSDAWALLGSSPAERVATPRSELFMNPDALAARESELATGDVVVFGEDLGFLSLLWNRAMDVRVVYLAPGPRFVDELTASNARWVVTRKDSYLAARVRRAGWQRVGELANGVVAWRRPSDDDTSPDDTSPDDTTADDTTADDTTADDTTDDDATADDTTDDVEAAGREATPSD